MLNTMRNLSKSIVSKLLMGLLVISFGIWGVGDVLRTSGPSFAATVGGETISVGEFQQQRAQIMRQLQSVGIQNLPPGKVEMTVIRQLIQQKLTLMTMRDMGLFVNDKLAGNVISTLPEFKDKDGAFSSAMFKFALERQHLSESVFVGQLKREIAGKFLIDSMSLKDATPPSSVLALEAMTAGETRDAVLMTIPARDALDESNVAALKDYYEKHKDTDYQNPETRTLEYVVLTQGQIDALVEKSITADMLSQAAKDRPTVAKSELRTQLLKEQHDEVMHTLSNTVEDELAAGKTIAQAFAKAGITAETRELANATADMAKSSADDVIKTVAEQGFGLSQGEISRLISTKKGTLLMVSAKKINAAAPKPFEDVKADIKTHLAKELARDAARAKAQSVKAALAKAPNWQGVADEQKLATHVVSRIARPAPGASVEGVPLALQQSIFEHAVGEVAGPLALENGDQLIAVITASHVPSMDAASIKPSKATTALGKELSEDIENRAYQSFATRHSVVINPALMHPPTKDQE